jgi:hypothetical protein
MLATGFCEGRKRIRLACDLLLAFCLRAKAQKRMIHQPVFCVMLMCCRLGGHPSRLPSMSVDDLAPVGHQQRSTRGKPGAGGGGGAGPACCIIS